VSALAVGEPAPDIVLFGEGEIEVRLADRWHEGATILVFLRHFG
jgi:hypothetical protein